MPFSACTTWEFCQCFELSRYNEIYSSNIKFSDFDDKVNIIPGGCNLSAECDLLHVADLRNSNQCHIVDDPRLINAAESSFSLVHFNIRSIPAHVDEFLVLLESLQRPKALIIGFSEMWLIKSNELLYNLANFRGFFTSRDGRHVGGTALYISSHIECNDREDLSSIFGDCAECTVVEVFLTSVGHCKKVTICEFTDRLGLPSLNSWSICTNYCLLSLDLDHYPT